MAQNASEEQIRKIVEEVVTRIVADGSGVSGRPLANGDSGVFTSMDDAVQAATQAQIELAAMTLEQRKSIVEAIRRVSRDSAEDFPAALSPRPVWGDWKIKSRSTGLRPTLRRVWKTSKPNRGREITVSP